MILPFLKAYLEWVEKGAPNLQPFNNESGLCDNIYYFGAITLTEKDCLLSDLQGAFRQSGLDDTYPWGFNTFCQEVRDKSFHLNPQRIDWVKAKIKELEQ